MLRITRLHGVDHDTLLLEGKLLKGWIDELQRALEQARQDGRRIALDLSGLRFIDEEGVSFLRECRRHGALLLEASPFVSALLDPPLPPQRRPRL